MLALAFFGRFVQLRIFMLALSAIVCIAISALLPAQGIWGFLNLTAADYPAIVPATRELHLPILTACATAPSAHSPACRRKASSRSRASHTALGVIFIVALWPVPALRWFGVVVNALMMVSIPIDGGHYFIDMVAGTVVAVLCIMAARAMAIRAGRTPSPIVSGKIPQLAARD